MVKPTENCSLRDTTYFLAPLLDIKPQGLISFPRSLGIDLCTTPSRTHRSERKEIKVFFLALHSHSPLPLAKIFWAERKLVCLLLFDVLQNLVVPTPVPGKVEDGWSAWRPAVSQNPGCRVEFCVMSA